MLFEANFELLNFCAWAFCLCLFFTRFPTMLAPQTITDKFTIINYQAREYSRDATTGQWTLDGGRCLFFFWKTRHIFFASLTVDTRQTEINMTFSLLTLWQIIARHFFSISNLKTLGLEERESPACEEISKHNKEWGVKDFKMAFNWEKERKKEIEKNVIRQRKERKTMKMKIWF